MCKHYHLINNESLSKITVVTVRFFVSGVAFPLKSTAFIDELYKQNIDCTNTDGHTHASIFYVTNMYTHIHYEQHFSLVACLMGAG